MRLDARTMPFARQVGWTIWHVERCERVLNVVWADDASAQYGQYADLPRSDEIAIRQARQIRIYPDRLLVLINPLSDATPQEQITEEIEA